MKKGTLIILAYTVIVVALVVSVKLVQTYVTHSQTTHTSLLADCGDPPVTPSPGE
jgi:hypothetical protein